VLPNREWSSARHDNAHHDAPTSGARTSSGPQLAAPTARFIGLIFTAVWLLIALASPNRVVQYSSGAAPMRG